MLIIPIKGLSSSVHTTVAGPSRATELVTAKRANTHTSERSIHCINCLVVFHLEYVKQRSIGGDLSLGTVTKAVAPRVSRVIVKYLSLVRPLEEMWAERLFGSVGAKAYQSHLFVSNGQIMTGASMCNAFRDSMVRHVGLDLSIRPYRQLIKVIIRDEEGVDIDAIEPHSETAAIDSTFGHSALTAMGHYGGLSSSFSDVPEQAQRFLEQLDRRCHNRLGLGVNGMNTGFGAGVAASGTALPARRLAVAASIPGDVGVAVVAANHIVRVRNFYLIPCCRSH